MRGQTIPNGAPLGRAPLRESPRRLLGKKPITSMALSNGPCGEEVIDRQEKRTQGPRWAIAMSSSGDRTIRTICRRDWKV